MSQHKIGRSLYILLTLYSGAAGAADTTDADLQRLLPMSLADLINMPVVTASRQEENRSHTPANIVVITREQIRERRYRNLADLLEDLPGIDLMRGTRSSDYNNITVQGYNGSNKLQIMLDGVRIDNPSGSPTPIADNFSLYMADQVEVLFGPAAALYGADAVAGVINIVTGRAAAHPGVKVVTNLGRFNSRETDFLAGVKSKYSLALSLGGHVQHSDNAPLDQYYPSYYPKVDAKTFSGTVVVPAASRENYVGDTGSSSLYGRLDVGNDITLGFYRYTFHSLTSTGDKPADTLYLANARWETHSQTEYGKYRFDLSPTLSGELVVDHSLLEVVPASKYFNIYTNFQDTGYVYTKNERLGIEQNVNWKLNNAHSIQAGLGYQSYYALVTPDLPVPYNTGLDPTNQGLTYQNTTLPIQIYDAHFNNISAYTQLQSDWTASFNTVVGVRYDKQSYYGTSINPRLGAVWRLGEAHILKLMYGTAFRAPSPDEALTTYGSFSGSKDASGNYLGSGFRVPNYNLLPEKSKTVSLTWDWRPRSDLNVVTNLYHSQIRNLIVSAKEAVPTQYISGAVLTNTSIKTNAGEEAHTGLDLSAQWRFNLGRDWDGELRAGYSWIDGSIQQGTNPTYNLPYVATNTVKLGATFRYQDKLIVSPQVLIIGDTNTGATDANGNRIESPGYTVTNLHVGWQKLLDGKATLWFDIYNLFDVRYYNAHGSASTTLTQVPQQPRTWMTGLEYKF